MASCVPLSRFVIFEILPLDVVMLISLLDTGRHFSPSTELAIALTVIDISALRAKVILMAGQFAVLLYDSIGNVNSKIPTDNIENTKK